MLDENRLILFITAFLAILVIRKSRFKIVRPDVYLSLMAFISFILPQLYITDSVHWQTSFTFFIGFIAFNIPFLFKTRTSQKYKRIFNIDYTIKPRLKIFSKFYLPIVLLILYFSTFFRIKYSVGLPGYKPNIQYAGIYYYFLTTGIFVLISSYFLFVQKSGKGKILFIIMLFLYAIYQSILGWRQGVFDIIILLTILTFSLQIKLKNSFKIFTSLILFASIFITVYLRNMSRGSNKSLIDIWDRLFGVKYLDSVVGYFVKNTNHDIWFNNFFFTKLNQMNISTADFHNHVILGGSVDFINGSARTGFGTIYMLFGLSGVFVVFLLLGIYYKKLYYYYTELKFNAFISIFYGFNFIILQRIIVEQFDIGVIIHLIAFTFFTFLIYKLFNLIGLKNKSHAPTTRRHI